MKNDVDPRSLDLCAIGLGQGGGNLAAEWRRRGYRALVCNTAHADLQGLSRSEDLDVPEDDRLFIGLEGSDGAGRDPEYGRACVREHAQAIRDAVQHKLKGADAILIFAGLGGGTGSACDELIEALAPLDMPLLCVSTLPSHSESGITKVNAVKTANALVQKSLHGRIFVDNERLLQTHRDVGMGKFYPTVNAAVLSSLDAINRINSHEGWYSIKSFDGEDLRKVLLSGGVLNSHTIALDGEVNADSVVEAARLCVDGGEYFAQGLNLKGCPYLSVVITGPESALGTLSAEAFDQAIGALKETTGGGAVYEGMYISNDDDIVKVHVLSASLELPQRLSTLLAAAHTEGQELAKKISEEIPTLETGDLDALDLFRAPKRKEGADEEKPVPPKPRPLSEQLRASFPAASTTGAAIMDGGPAPLAASIPLPSLTPAAEAPKEVSVEAPAASSEVADDDVSEDSADGGALTPMVGTGRYDPVSELDETAAVNVADIRKEIAHNQVARAASASSAAPRVGTGTYDAEADLEPTQMRRDIDLNKVGGGLSELDEQKDPSLLPPPIGGGDEAPAGINEEVTDKKEMPDEAPARPPPGFEDVAVMTNQIEEADIVDELPSRVAEGLGEVTNAAPMNPEADQLLSSVLAASGDDLLAVYEDLIDRFRQAPDKRGRERVARRLIDDAKKPDVEMRALAVWAMNRLEQSGFKRALKKATTDENAEIRRLAKDGLARIKKNKKSA